MTEQSYGQLAFLFAKKEVRKIQNKQTRHILMGGGEEETNSLSFRLLHYLHHDAGCSYLLLFFALLLPFKINNLNTKSLNYIFFCLA